MSVMGGPLCVICDHPLDSHSEGGRGGCTATVGREEDGSLIRCDCQKGVDPRGASAKSGAVPEWIKVEGDGYKCPGCGREFRNGTLQASMMAVAGHWPNCPSRRTEDDGDDD